MNRHRMAPLLAAWPLPLARVMSATVLVGLAACSQPQAVSNQAAAHSGPPDAVVVLRTPDGRNAGRVTLRDTSVGVQLHVEATGLTPGQHGFHIHESGTCASGPDAKTGMPTPFGAAAGHFDPGATRDHGEPNAPADHVHAGELPNLTADASGRASLHHVNRHVTLAAGKGSVMGRSLVVHAGPDDYRTDPDGSSGPRVLCGVIEPVQTNTVIGRDTLRGTNVFPERVAVDAATGDRYVGSAGEGHLYKLSARSAEAEVFQAGGAPGRQAAFGLKVDEQRQLWVAGGPTGTVAVVDLASATTRAVLHAPPGLPASVNDLVISGDHVYVTDSHRPVIYRISRRSPEPRLEPWLDLTRTPVRYQPDEMNLNGIVASADGRSLLAVQLATGQLWRIDTSTQAVTEVKVEGGSLVHGDGLAMQGANALYVVRNAENEVVRVDLAPDWSAGQVVQRLQDRRLRYPTSAAATPQRPVMVSGHVNKQNAAVTVRTLDGLTLTPQQASAPG